MKKENGLTLVSAIIIAIIVIFIIAVVIIIISINSSEKKNEGNIQVANTMQTIETASPTSEKEQNKEPDGKPYVLQVKKIEKADANLNTTNLDHIFINDFNLMISGKLKEIGYDIKFNKDKTILNIVSKDNKYSCKLVCFSDKAPYQLNEEQQKELNEIVSTGGDVNSFYKKYNINKYTSFDGFSDSEMKAAWNLIGVSEEDLQDKSESINEEEKLYSF